MKAGFDLDGVIAEISIPLWLLMDQVKDQKSKDVIRQFIQIPNLKFHPNEFLHEDDEYVIITGRSRKFYDLTKRWLKTHGISTSSLFVCNVGIVSDYKSIDEYNIEMAKAKAKYINSECVEVFFEDSPEVVKLLRKFCPKTKIVQIGGRLK